MAAAAHARAGAPMGVEACTRRVQVRGRGARASGDGREARAARWGRRCLGAASIARGPAVDQKERRGAGHVRECRGSEGVAIDGLGARGAGASLSYERGLVWQV